MTITGIFAFPLTTQPRGFSCGRFPLARQPLDIAITAEWVARVEQDGKFVFIYLTILLPPFSGAITIGSRQCRRQSLRFTAAAAPSVLTLHTSPYHIDGLDRRIS